MRPISEFTLIVSKENLSTRLEGYYFHCFCICEKRVIFVIVVVCFVFLLLFFFCCCCFFCFVFNFGKLRDYTRISLMQMYDMTRLQ